MNIHQTWYVHRQIHPLLTDLSACNTSVFYFQDNNLSKLQWIFTKFDTCIDIVEICLGLLIGKCRQFLTELSALDNGEVLSFQVLFQLTFVLIFLLFLHKNICCCTY